MFGEYSDGLSKMFDDFRKFKSRFEYSIVHLSLFFFLFYGGSECAICLENIQTV